MGYSPWGHKDSDTTERLNLYHLRHTRAQKDPILSSFEFASFSGIFAVEKKNVTHLATN